MTAQPAWQFPITHGLPSASGCRAITFSTKTASAFAMSSIVWPARFRQKADEIAGMAGFHRHADLAVRLESTDPRPVARAGVDHNERTSLYIDLHTIWWRNAHQPIVHRPLKLLPSRISSTS